MARITDLQQQLIKSEGQSGEFLFKQLLADLTTVYNRGYEGEMNLEKSSIHDSYWEEAFKEFRDEGKRAVKKGKSKEAQEVLKDLETLQKSLAATEEISGSGIGAGTMAMLLAVKPHIEKRITTLKKNEGIFISMKKKAIASAAGAVEGFASNLLAPLPFGAGEAIIGKSKGFLGAGKGDKAERQAEQAVSFAGRIERDGGTGGPGGNGPGGNGPGGNGPGGDGDNSGVIQALGRIEDLLVAGLFGSPPLLKTMNESLDDLIGVSKPDKETAREEEREDDREHKETIDAMKKAGGVGVAGLAGAGAAGGGGDGLSWLDLLIHGRVTSWLDKKGGIGGLLTGMLGGGKGSKFVSGGAVAGQMSLPGLGGKGGLSKGVLSRLNIIPYLARLGPMLLNPYVLGAIAIGGLAWWLLSGDDDETTAGKQRARAKQKARKTPSRFQPTASHAEGVTDVEQTHYAKIHKGETVLDNKASKDFKTGLETLKHLQNNLGVQLMPLVEIMGHSVEELKKQGYKGTMMVPDRSQDALMELGYIGDTWKDSKWAKGLDELFEHFIQVDTETAFHRIARVKSAQEVLVGHKMSGMKTANEGKELSKEWKERNKKGGIGGVGLISDKQEALQEALYALGLDWGARPKTLTKATREEGGKMRIGLGRRKKSDNPLHKVKQTMENMSLSQMAQLQGSVKKYMLLREALQIADGTLEAVYSVWGAGDIVTGPDKDIFRTNFGKDYATTQNLLAKGTGLGMVERIRPLLAAASAEVQNLVGGKAFYKPTDQSVYDARNSISGRYGMGVAKGGLGLLHKGEEVLEKAEVATIAQALAGNQLNNAAYNRVGLGGPAGMGSAPTVINAPTTVNNDTIIPPRLTSPHARDAFGERKDFVSKIA